MSTHAFCVSIIPLLKPTQPTEDFKKKTCFHIFRSNIKEHIHKNGLKRSQFFRKNFRAKQTSDLIEKYKQKVGL